MVGGFGGMVLVVDVVGGVVVGAVVGVFGVMLVVVFKLIVKSPKEIHL